MGAGKRISMLSAATLRKFKLHVIQCDGDLPLAHARAPTQTKRVKENESIRN